MAGASHTSARERTVEDEFIILRADEAGRIPPVAKPSAQAEAVFKRVRFSATEAVVENLAHDSSQRNSYLLQGVGNLPAASEGTRNGQNRRVEFPYRRVTK